MNRKLVVGSLALSVVAVAVGVWLVFLRGHGGERPSGVAGPTTASPARPTAPVKPAAQGPAPRGVAPRWSADPDREGPLQLEGQVLGPDGHGAGGAEVWLDSVPPRSTKTEDDGTFSFTKLVGRTYSLSATRGELYGGPVREKLTAHSDPIVIRLAEAAAISVIVLDEARQPIKDAEVRLDEIAARTVKTSDKGTARIAPVRPGWVQVHASASGYAPGTGFTSVGSAGATAELTLTLRKGYAVSGHVIDDTGKPVARARVAASGGLLGDAGTESSGATTDDKGAFTIAALATGSHILVAVDGEHAPARSSPITVADRPVANAEIVMHAGGVIAGKVVDATHKAVPFATVRVAGNSQQFWQGEARQTTSDQQGSFELRGLARAKLQARAESDTAASKIADADLTDKPRLDGLELVLDVEGSIAGTVVDDKGAPVAEVQVNAFPDFLGGASTDGLALAGLSSTTTGGGGEFVIHGLPDGAYRVWAGRRSGALSFGQDGTTARTGDKAVKITLAAPGSLTGSLVLAGANAAPKQATVAVGFQTPTPVSGGAFEVKDVTPGTYEVTFRGLEFAELIKHDVKIEPGKTTDLGAITVTRGRRLSGRVVDKAGAAVAGARIKAGAMLISLADASDQSASFDDASGIRSTVSDQDGAFMLVGLPAKETNVMAEHADRGRSVAITVPAAEADPPDVTLTLQGFGSITGKVTRKGQPAADITISESSKGGGAQGQFTKTGSDGTFVLSKVPEGMHIINAMQQAMMSMKSTSTTVQVTAGKQATATIEIPVGDVTLTVAVKPAAGAKVDAAQIFVFAGAVNVTTGRQLVDGVFQRSIQGMKFWLGKAAPDFAELVAGDYSVCGVPITGDMSDMQFQQRLQQNTASLKVYCKAAHVTPSPLTQTFELELPAMTPLPAPAK